MDPVDELSHSGYTVLRSVFDADSMDALGRRLSVALRADERSVLLSRGQAYGSRDLIRLLPEVCDIPRHPTSKEFIAAVLGPRAGLVRALFFDKPPDCTWSLPWHKDRTIAVRAVDMGRRYTALRERLDRAFDRPVTLSSVDATANAAALLHGQTDGRILSRCSAAVIEPSHTILSSLRLMLG
jgi:hypothetical protein